MDDERWTFSKQKLELLSKLNFAKPKLQKEKTSVAKLKKALWKIDKIIEMN